VENHCAWKAHELLQSLLVSLLRKMVGNDKPVAHPTWPTWPGESKCRNAERHGGIPTRSERED